MENKLYIFFRFIDFEDLWILPDLVDEIFGNIYMLIYYWPGSSSSGDVNVFMSPPLLIYFDASH